MVFARVFVMVFLLVVVTSTIITFILPESYASTARISVDADNAGKWKVVQSEAVLGPAINKLNLNADWGRKYNAGQTLNSTNTLFFLKARLDVFPEPIGQVIDIKVFSEDKNEAARIANAIADAYTNLLHSAANSATSAAKIEIVERAKPGHEPVRPNKPLNLFIGVVAGIILGSIAGGAVAGFVSLPRRKTVPN
ncbi:MAG: hypothetical protein ABSE90_07270 [Verrucomicrobiota bacterium]